MDNAPPQSLLLGGERADTPCKWCNCLLSRCDAIRPNRKCCPDCRHPKRVQRRRTKGFHLPAAARSVTRPSRYGNPFRIVGCSVVGMNWTDVVEWEHGIGAMPEADVLYLEVADRLTAVQHAVELYRELLHVREHEWEPTRFAKWISDARGRDLACYCRLTEPCHADPLLEVANGSTIDLAFQQHCRGCGQPFSGHGLRAHQSGRFASPGCAAGARH